MTTSQYHVPLHSISIDSFCSSLSNTLKTNNISSLSLFHAFLGYTSLSKLEHLSCCKHLDFNNFSCDVCYVAKGHHLPFSRNEHTFSTLFALLHVDLWGPYHVSHSGRVIFF